MIEVATQQLCSMEARKGQSIASYPRVCIKSKSLQTRLASDITCRTRLDFNEPEFGVSNVTVSLNPSSTLCPFPSLSLLPPNSPSHGYDIRSRGVVFRYCNQAHSGQPFTFRSQKQTHRCSHWRGHLLLLWYPRPFQFRLSRGLLSSSDDLLVHAGFSLFRWALCTREEPVSRHNIKGARLIRRLSLS